MRPATTAPTISAPPARSSPISTVVAGRRSSPPPPTNATAVRMAPKPSVHSTTGRRTGDGGDPSERGEVSGRGVRGHEAGLRRPRCPPRRSRERRAGRSGLGEGRSGILRCSAPSDAGLNDLAADLDRLAARADRVGRPPSAGRWRRWPAGRCRPSSGAGVGAAAATLAADDGSAPLLGDGPPPPLEPPVPVRGDLAGRRPWVLAVLGPAAGRGELRAADHALAVRVLDDVAAAGGERLRVVARGCGAGRCCPSLAQSLTTDCHDACAAAGTSSRHAVRARRSAAHEGGHASKPPRWRESIAIGPRVEGVGRDVGRAPGRRAGRAAAASSRRRRSAPRRARSASPAATTSPLRSWRTRPPAAAPVWSVAMTGIDWCIASLTTSPHGSRNVRVRTDGTTRTSATT